MNEKVWHEIFKKYIDYFRSINKLHAHNIIDEEEALQKLKTCDDNCGHCVFLDSKWEGPRFAGLYCRKGYW